LSMAMSSCTLGLTFLTLLKNESYEGLRVPLVIEVALKKGFHATLEELAIQKRRQENPNAKFIIDNDILKTVQKRTEQADRTLFHLSFDRPRVLVALLNLVLPAAKRIGFSDIPELAYVLTNLKGSDSGTGEMLTHSAIAALLKKRDWASLTPLEELKSSFYSMAMSLAASVLSDEPTIIPKFNRELVKPNNLPLLQRLHEENNTKTIAAIITEVNAEGKTILQNEMTNETYEVLLSMAVSAVNNQPDVIPEVAREMRQFKNRNQIKAIVKTSSFGITKKLDEKKALSSETIKAIIEERDEDGKTFFKANRDDIEGYRIMLALTISIIIREESEARKNKRLFEELNRELKKVANKNIRKSLKYGSLSSLLPTKTINALKI